MPEDKRVKNCFHPKRFLEFLNSNVWQVELEFLDWYKKGYFLKADKIIKE